MISNDFDWNVKEKKFYQRDACTFSLREYEWDPKSGKICMFKARSIKSFMDNNDNMNLDFLGKGRTIYSYCNSFGTPLVTGIGLTVDCAGNIFAGI